MAFPSRIPSLSRREFVRTSALAAGAVALAGPFMRVARAGEPGANSKLRVGLIGCGGMGTGDLATFFRNPEVDCADVIEHLAPDVLQTDLADFDYLEVPDDIARWPVLREHELADIAGLPATFVYEGRQSGKGVTVDWSRAAAIAGRGRMMLAGGLDVDNVARAIAEVRPWGVDVSSGVESAPGIKDPERISAFISAARAAASRREQVQ
jgi:hypothetical protein